MPHVLKVVPVSKLVHVRCSNLAKGKRRKLPVTLACINVSFARRIVLKGRLRLSRREQVLPELIMRNVTAAGFV